MHACVFILFATILGYFHGAICQSGTEMTSWAYGSKSQRPENMTRSVAEQLGCDLPSNADMVECLRQINATTLIDTIPDLMVICHIEMFSIRMKLIR